MLGVGKYAFAIHFYSIMPLPPNGFGSLSTCITENFVLKCVFILDNCFQLCFMGQRCFKKLFENQVRCRNYFDFCIVSGIGSDLVELFSA